jgi:hypothetical protein
MIVGSRQRISNILTDPIVKLGDSTIKRVNKSKTLGSLLMSTSYGTTKYKVLFQNLQKV